MLLLADSGRERSAPAKPLLLLLPSPPLLGRSSFDFLSNGSSDDTVGVDLPDSFDNLAFVSTTCCLLDNSVDLTTFPFFLLSIGLGSSTREIPFLVPFARTAVLSFNNLPSFVSKLVRSPRACCTSFPSLLLVFALFTILSGAIELLKRGVATALFTSGNVIVGVILIFISGGLAVVLSEVTVLDGDVIVTVVTTLC